MKRFSLENTDSLRRYLRSNMEFLIKSGERTCRIANSPMVRILIQDVGGSDYSPSSAWLRVGTVNCVSHIPSKCPIYQDILGCDALSRTQVFFPPQNISKALIFIPMQNGNRFQNLNVCSEMEFLFSGQSYKWSPVATPLKSAILVHEVVYLWARSSNTDVNWQHRCVYIGLQYFTCLF